MQCDPTRKCWMNKLSIFIKRMKQLLFLILFAMLGFLTFTVSAQSGKTGKLRWTISNGTLTISGVGAMPDYKYKLGRHRYNSPWYSYLRKISNIVICDGVSSIGDNAFYLDENDGWNFANGLGAEITMGDKFLNYCGSTYVSLPNSIVTIGDGAFRNCRKLTSVVIPNSVVTIGSSAFSDCHGLISVNIPNSITTLEGYVFDGCINMTSISIPNSVASISYSAFRGCHSLTSVSVPNSVTVIGGDAFAWSRGLTSITIPNSVVEIDNTAFEGCNNLSEIVNYATIPQTITPFKTFSNLNKSKCILRVPESAMDAYRLADGWREFENIVAIK